MKNYLYVLIIFIPSVIFSQVEYTVTVIDSFTCYHGGQAGVSAIRSVEYNGDIHLSYLMQDTTSTLSLMYAVKNEVGISFEVVDVLSNETIGSSANTSIQFDANGLPNIYLARLLNVGVPDQRGIYWYRKVNNEWVSSLIDNTGYWPYMAADHDGSRELGFVYWSPADNFFSGHITYAYHDGTNWNFETLTDNGVVPRTRPSILNYDNKTYVSYGQGHALDTLITRVHVKDNNGWSIDFEDVNLTTYSGGGIDGLYVRLGESSEGISLLTSLHTEGGHPLYLKNDGQSWQQETVNFNGSLTSQGWPAPNLQYDSENTVYWLNQDNSSNNLSWVKENGEGGLYKFPWFHSNKYLFDFVIKDNTVYIYYWEGSASWPYGTPVTFNELKINLAAFTSSIVESEFKVGAILQQNYPNPFSYNTIIKFSLSNSSLVDLSVYNVKGEKIITLVNELRTGGDYTESFNVNQLSKGTYFYILTLNENSLTKKMFVIK